MDLTYFNPHSQTEADFLANFVARQSTLDFFLRQLRLDRHREPSRHHLIVAPRGYGKTSLLRRIAVAVRTESDLQRRFIALTFREEQHNVISLDVFWRNCLQSLLEAREDEGAPTDEIKQLDAAWDEFAPRQALKRSEQDGEPAWREFHRRCDQLQRRPLLLTDNLDALLAGLEPNHQWALRRTLQSDDGPMLIAAASRYPDATGDPSAAFHDFFRIHTLDRLSDREVMHFLRTLATRRGERGRDVLTLLDKDPGRISALNALAGGNPRTLNVLYGVLESHMSADVLSQLSAMLDTFTAWYQARTEELPMQGRAVFDALALNWDPMTAASLGETTGLDTTAVSSQLTRLEKAGFVETVALSKRSKGRNGYQISERFFNIWYLMRNGPRRRRNEIRFLTAFLQSCFSDAERRLMARAALDDDDFRPGYSLALASSLRSSRLRDQRLDHARSLSARLGESDEYAVLIEEIQRQGRRKGQPKPSSLEELLVSLNQSITQQLESSEDDSDRERLAEALVSKGLTLSFLGRKDEALQNYDLVVSRCGASSNVVLRRHVIEAILQKSELLGLSGRHEQAIAGAEDVLRRLDGVSGPESRSQTYRALAVTILALAWLDRFDEVHEACERLDWDAYLTVRPAFRVSLPGAYMVKLAVLFTLGRKNEMLERVDWIIERFSDDQVSSYRLLAVVALIYKGKMMHAEGDSSHSLEIYEQALTRLAGFDGSGTRRPISEAYYLLGKWLTEVGRDPRAEFAYRHSVEANPANTRSWNVLGRLLLDRLGDVAAAREAFLRGLAEAATEEDRSRFRSSLAYACALHGDDDHVAEVREHVSAALESEISTAGRLLLGALPEAANAAKVIEQIGRAVASEDSTLWSVHLVELQRLMAYLLLNGQGDALRSWMERADYPTKYAPLYHAVVAAIQGEDHLLRINPEVRAPAAALLEGLAHLLTLYGPKSSRSGKHPAR